MEKRERKKKKRNKMETDWEKKECENQTLRNHREKNKGSNDRELKKKKKKGELLFQRNTRIKTIPIIFFYQMKQFASLSLVTYLLVEDHTTHTNDGSYDDEIAN